MPLKPERITQITDRMSSARVLILGDIMLDEYLYGSVGRISPEAPVPVVEITSSKILLGGAANVAANIRALGDEPLLLGTVGDDEAASKITHLLSEKGIASDFLIEDKGRQSTIKTRIIAHGQQVVRADREDRHELDEGTQARVLERLQSVIGDIDAVIISDYGKGVICKPLLDKVITICRENEVFVAVDPKETHFHNYKHVSLITPNHHEAGFAYGLRIRSVENLIEVGNGLLKQLRASSILITRGADGMSLFREGSPPTHIPTFARKVFDVTGAGDTVIATFVSSICGGADLVEAAVVANCGAGITVREIGTTTVTVSQLREELALNLKNGNLNVALPVSR